LTSKKRKIEYFSDLELNDEYLDKLKTHLHINTYKKQKDDIKQANDDLIIDLSSTMTQCEENMNNNSSQDLNIVTLEEKVNKSKLKMPEME
jgi:hypoxanthine-guanine phosphoribosyltransferase